MLLFQRGDIALGQALRARLQHAAHDLAGARLGQLVHEVDVLRAGDRAHVLGDVLAQFLGQLGRAAEARCAA